MSRLQLENWQPPGGFQWFIDVLKRTSIRTISARVISVWWSGVSQRQQSSSVSTCRESCQKLAVSRVHISRPISSTVNVSPSTVNVSQSSMFQPEFSSTLGEAGVSIRVSIVKEYSLRYSIYQDGPLIIQGNSCDIGGRCSWLPVSQNMSNIRDICSEIICL